MGLGDKISAEKDDAKGKVKEGYGKATDDSSVEAEGKLDQAKADVKRGVEKVKDSIKNAVD